MHQGSVLWAIPSSAPGSNLALHPRVETGPSGSTHATMTRAPATPTVQGVKVFSELPPIARGGSGPPLGLRVVGFGALVVIFGSVLTTQPLPGLHGDGRWVLLGLILLAAGIAGSLRREALPDGVRLGALIVAAAGTCILTAVQPDSAGFAGIYYVVVI